AISSARLRRTQRCGHPKSQSPPGSSPSPSPPWDQLLPGFFIFDLRSEVQFHRRSKIENLRSVQIAELRLRTIRLCNRDDSRLRHHEATLTVQVQVVTNLH